MKKEEEQNLLKEIDELIEFFSPAKQTEEKRIEFQRLQLTDERTAQIEQAVDPEELEAELAQNVSKMKQHVVNFSDYLEEDKLRVEKLSGLQDTNKRAFGDNVSGIINFQKLSDELGFFKLLKMAIFAVLLFVLTVTFIMVDAFIF